MSRHTISADESGCDRSITGPGLNLVSRNGESAEATRGRSAIPSGPRSRRAVAWFLAVAAVCGLAGLAAAQQVTAKPDKIDPAILAHQQFKIRPSGVTPQTHAARLHRLGLDAANLTGEQCALYVVERLDATEIDALSPQGIAVNTEVWVPPMSGKHPHGFQLATVDYASLDVIRNDPRFVRAASVESRSAPLNNSARVMINVSDIHNGVGVTARDGSGVTIAVADSGIDLSHSDFPTPIEAFDMTSGTNTGNWGTNVANTVMDHGTHVTGSVLGRGTLSVNSMFRGGAPGAGLVFHKIGNNTDASATNTDMIESINRASTIGCDEFSMSYGGVGAYMDGSSPVCQAIDTAFAGGMVCFIAAGNDGNTSIHDSASVAPGTTSATFSYTVDNSGGASTYSGPEDLRVIWRDRVSDNNMVLSCTNLGASEVLAQPWSGTSSRMTEARQYLLTTNIAAGGAKTYNFTLQNTAASGTTPLVHCYRAAGMGTYDSPDNSYTINHPAVADDAIAVGAWTQRKDWYDFQNNWWEYAWLTVGTLAPFSSLGPRIDGVIKPDIVAPGAVTISCKDSGTFPAFPQNWATIDNDGSNNGAGPADYYVSQGTSMACPMAAGASALLLEAVPALSPSQLRTALISTASLAGAPDNSVGWGLIDLLAALQGVDCNDNGVFDPVDLSSGTSQDCNGNLIPDECDLVANPMAFATANHGVLNGPMDMTSADLDGDNDLDMAIGTLGGSGQIPLLFNNGDGTFTSTLQYAWWMSARYLVAGDLDGDGDADLATSNTSGNTVQVMTNDGSGTFSRGTSPFVIGPTHITAAHLNPDADLDLAVLAQGVTVLLGTGNGLFGPPTAYTVPGGSTNLAVGDLDNDGAVDLAVTGGSAGTGSVAVLMNQGDGTFGSAVSYPATFGVAYSVAIADLDADGDLDVAVRTAYQSGSYWYGDVSILLNNGDGTFAAASSQSVPPIFGTNLYHAPIVASDLNGDAIPDLAVSVYDMQNPALVVLVNDGSASFTQQFPTFMPFDPNYGNHIVVGDWDGDGAVDLGIAGGANSVSIVLNQTTAPVGGTDCNANGVPDNCDLSAGTSQDCQGDGIPDDCQLAGNDCNGNGVPDECDISGGGSQDVNGNGVPDECEVFCATCKGDMNGDNKVNGNDTQAFISCYLGGNAGTSACSCADMDDSGGFDANDITQFKNRLLGTNACP